MEKLYKNWMMLLPIYQQGFRVFTSRYVFGWHSVLQSVEIFLEIIKFSNEYSEKLQSRVQKEKELIILAWKVKELTELNENGRQLYTDASSLAKKLEKNIIYGGKTISHLS